jgi:hypothetical protein
LRAQEIPNVSQSTLRKTFFLSLLAVMAFSTRAVIAQTSAPKPVPPIMTPDDGGNPATEMEMATPEIFWRYTGARRSTHKLTVEVAHRS